MPALRVSPSTSPSHGALSRRQALRGLALAAGGIIMAGACRPGAPGGEGVPRAPMFDREVQLRWTTWGNETHPMVRASTLGVEAFTRHFPKVKVENLPDPGPAPITAQMAAGDAPDVIGQCCTSLPEWARKNATENLDPYIR